MPWREISETLRDIDYDRDVAMEPFVKMGGQGGPDNKLLRPICGEITEEKLDQDAGEVLKCKDRMIKYMLWESGSLPRANFQ